MIRTAFENQKAVAMPRPQYEKFDEVGRTGHRQLQRARKEVIATRAGMEVMGGRNGRDATK